MISRRSLFAALALAPLLSAQQRTTQRRRGDKPTGAGGSSPEEVLLQFPGTLRSVTKKQILLEVANEQELIFRCTKKTRFFDGEKVAKDDDAPVGSKIVIEGRRELNGDLDAVNVRWNIKPPAEREP